MSQPPNDPPTPPQRSAESTPSKSRRPDWLRPPGVAAGTWAYTQQRSIADHYSDFVANTPLCDLDQEFLVDHFPDVTAGQSKPPPIILDLGCGNGRTAIPLTRRGYRVLGVDLSQPMLEQMIRSIDTDHLAESSCPTPNAKYLMPLRANLVQLDCIADNVVDHATCLFSTLGMIQGRHHRRVVLEHASRIVRPGGTLLLHVHHIWSSLHEPGGLTRTAKSLLRSTTDKDHDFGDHVYAYRGLEKMFLHRYSRRELITDLQQSGWTNINVQSISLDGTSFIQPRSWQFHHVGGFLVSCQSAVGVGRQQGSAQFRRHT